MGESDFVSSAAVASEPSHGEKNLKETKGSVERLPLGIGVPGAGKRKCMVDLITSHYPGNVTGMSIAQSKLTAQGQISVPVEVRKKLGLGPGSTLEWSELGDKVVVTKAGKYSWKDVRTALFGAKSPKARSLEALKKGLRQHIRRKHASD